jgi:hypothetical protein
MSITRSVLLCSIIAGSTIASAQSVSLKFKPPVGKKYVYMTSMSMTGGGMAGMNMNMKETGVTTFKILSRAGDLTSLSIATSNVKITVPEGSPMKAGIPNMEKQANVTTTMKVNSLGKASSVSVKGGADQMMQLAGDLMGTGGAFLNYPQAPVKPGSTWTSTLDLGKILGKRMPMMKISGGLLTLKMKLDKFVTSGGKRLAQVSMKGSGKASMSMNQGSGPAGKTPTMTMTIGVTMDSVTMIDIATGMAVSVTSNSSNKMSMGGQGSMTQSVKSSMKLK